MLLQYMQRIGERTTERVWQPERGPRGTEQSNNLEIVTRRHTTVTASATMARIRAVI